MEDRTSLVIFIFASLFVIGVKCIEATSDEIRDHPRLIQNALTIADLDEHIQSLKVKLDKAKVAARLYLRTYRDIIFRIKKLEGTVCSENEFECGDDKYQCVSEVLACDGVKDCKNGRDEDPQFCDTSGYSAATVYTGAAPMYPCFSGKRESLLHNNFILSVKRSKIFPSQLHVAHKVEIQLGENFASSRGVKGEMQLGTRRAENHYGRFVGRCQFVEDSFDRMYCSTYKDGHQSPCQRYIPLNKQYPEK